MSKKRWTRAWAVLTVVSFEVLTATAVRAESGQGPQIARGPLDVYVFNDITTGRLFHVDLPELRSGHRRCPARIRELGVVRRAADGRPRPVRVYDVVADAYAQRRG